MGPRLRSGPSGDAARVSCPQFLPGRRSSLLRGLSGTSVCRFSGRPQRAQAPGTPRSVAPSTFRLHPNNSPKQPHPNPRDSGEVQRGRLPLQEDRVPEALAALISGCWAQAARCRGAFPRNPAGRQPSGRQAPSSCLLSPHPGGTDPACPSPAWDTRVCFRGHLGAQPPPHASPAGCRRVPSARLLPRPSLHAAPRAPETMGPNPATHSRGARELRTSSAQRRPRRRSRVPRRWKRRFLSPVTPPVSRGAREPGRGADRGRQTVSFPGGRWGRAAASAVWSRPPAAGCGACGARGRWGVRRGP